MKNFVIVLHFMLLFPLVLSGQSIKTLHLTFNSSAFEFEEHDSLMYIRTSAYTYSLHGDTTKPALPFVAVYVLVGADSEYINHNSSMSDSLIRTDVIMSSVPTESPTNAVANISANRVVYQNTTYPSENILYTGTHVTGGYKFLCFEICPFKYDAIEKCLYLTSEVNLNIFIENGLSSFFPYPETVSKELVSKLVANKDELEFLYSGTRQIRNENSMLDDSLCEYLIVTCDSLKPEFQRLANWKTLKGVRSNILTIEDISQNVPGETMQIKIKKALMDYYEMSGHKLEYVLLGGDNDIVPAERCYIEYGSNSAYVPTDLYYASMKDLRWDTDSSTHSDELQIDISPDIIVTRICASNRQNARSQIDRILEYEQKPDTTRWKDNILLCGTKLYFREWYDGVYMSDTHYKTENYLYGDYIRDYWPSGHRYMLYDTGSSFEGGADYDFSVANFQTQMQSGYSFIHVETHGAPDAWKVEYKYNTPHFYYNSDAQLLNNPYYTIITTSSCYTNAFSEGSACLSEALMQNSKSGILAYYGCSDKGWCNTDPYRIGISSEFCGKFYKELFTDEHHQIGRAVYHSKAKYLSSCNKFNLQRWLMFGMNALCDPEMPVYLSKPATFDNVDISLENNVLSVNTGIENSRICVASIMDGGETYYCVVDSVDQYQFNLNGDAYSVCITKQGYIPFVGEISDSLFIQNETIDADRSFYGKNLLVGKDVTTMKDQGPVVIVAGKTEMIYENSVTIENDFEVKNGAMLEIRKKLQ